MQVTQQDVKTKAGFQNNPARNNRALKELLPESRVQTFWVKKKAASL
jgi:hypothetical protein